MPERTPLLATVLLTAITIGIIASLVFAGPAGATLQTDSEPADAVATATSTEYPESFQIAVSGSYQYERLPAEAQRVTVDAYFVDEHQSREYQLANGDPFVSQAFDASGTDGSGSYQNLTGNVHPIAFDNNVPPATGRDVKNTTQPVVVQTTVHYGDGRTIVRNSTHTVTFELTLVAENDGQGDPAVDASSSIGADIVLPDGAEVES